MTTELVGTEAVETRYGQYEVHHHRRDYWVVWSPKAKAPIAVFDTDPTERLNELELGQRPPQRDWYQSVAEVIDAAECLAFTWDKVKHLDCSVTDKLIEATKLCYDVEELRLLADLAANAARLENETDGEK